MRAYTAKRAKELDAAQQLFSPEAMRQAYARAEAACDGLEERLRTAGSPWLFGDRVTMADLFWGVEFTRLALLGADSFWQGGVRPAVAACVQRTRELRAIREAVIDWPGALF